MKLRFSLLTLIVAVTLAATFSGIAIRQQRRAAQRERAMQGLLTNKAVALTRLVRSSRPQYKAALRSSVKDDDLDALLWVKGLESVTITSGRVTDQGLAKLRSIKTLTHVFLANTGVSSAGAARFRKARPDVRFIYFGRHAKPRRVASRE